MRISDWSSDVCSSDLVPGCVIFVLRIALLPLDRICSYYRFKRYFSVNRKNLQDTAPRLPIGMLSRRTGCNIETIRYYEKIGLLPAPARRDGGHRLFGQGPLMRLGFVRRARHLRPPERPPAHHPPPPPPPPPP